LAADFPCWCELEACINKKKPSREEKIMIKKIKRALIVLGIFSSLVGYSQSDWQLGATFGAGFSQINFDQNDDQLKMLPSFYLGSEVNVAISRHLLFRTQLRYSIKGVERNNYYSDRSRTVRVHYIDLY
jgi:hypothetical protein